MTYLDFWLGDDGRVEKRKSAETLVNLCIGVGRSAALADVPATRDHCGVHSRNVRVQVRIDADYGDTNRSWIQQDRL